MMKYREPNMVKWAGVRPGHNGEQILELGYRNGAGNAIIHTVGAGKTLFLTYLHLSTRLSAAAVGVARIDVWDTTPAGWKDLMYHVYLAAGEQVETVSLFYPIEIPSLYTVRISVTIANIDGYGVIHGWEE